MALGYGMYDADNHLYESEDSWTRHLPPGREQDVFWVHGPRNRRHLVIDNNIYDYVPNLTFDPVGVAGQLENRSKIGIEAPKVEPLARHPEYQHRDARMRVFDEQGIEAALLFSTAANGLVEKTGHNLPLYYDLMWAFNRWLDDDWGFAYDDRMYGAPMIPFADPDRTVEMVDWALGRGARAVSVAANPALTAYGYRSPADEMFDPVWARLNEAHVLIAVHAGASRYNRYSGDWTGNYETARSTGRSAMVDRIMNQGRALSDYCTALIWQGVLTRFPNIRVASIENRAEWISPLLEIYRQNFRAGMLPEDPVETFKRCVWISPHWEEDLEALAAELTAEHVLAGSDWPHPDALAEPANYVKYLDGWSDDDVRLVMRENLRALLSA